MDCIRGFPYPLYEFAKHIHGATFEVSPAAIQLGTIVDRVTYLGACELLLSPDKISTFSLGLGDANIAGALLERQILSLDGSRWKESTRSVVQALLRAALDVYGETNMPVRRARILLRCLDFLYHSGPESHLDLGSPRDIGEEVERILTQKVRALRSLVDVLVLISRRVWAKILRSPFFVPNIVLRHICGWRFTHIAAQIQTKPRLSPNT